MGAENNSIAAYFVTVWCVSFNIFLEQKIDDRKSFSRFVSQDI